MQMGLRLRNHHRFAGGTQRDGQEDERELARTRAFIREESTSSTLPACGLANYGYTPPWNKLRPDFYVNEVLKPTRDLVQNIISVSQHA